MEIEKLIAGRLLETKAVKLSPEKPFLWASGWNSPIYCDNRTLLSYPSIRKEITDAFVSVVEKNFADAEIIAGVATGAIAWGVLVAEAMGKPFVYVRPKPKDHGLGAQVEGNLPKGARVLVIEDLVSTGKSSLSAVDALEKSGATVEGMVAIFSYHFIKSIEAFEQANVTLYTLSHYEALLEEAVEMNYIDAKVLDVLKTWRINPELWGK